MLLWSASLYCLFHALRSLAPDIDIVSGAFRLGKERRELLRIGSLLLEIEETLAAGILPRAEKWELMRSLPAPWGALASESLQQLRSSGAAVLPTLKRLRALAEEHCASLAHAKARSGQALAQALACAGIVPVFGLVLWLLLPAVAESPFAWIAACAVAMGLAAASVSWMLSLADRARWAGLEPAARPWVLLALCAGERFLALIRCGTPADLSWAQSCEFLSHEAPGLASRWGHGVWAPAPESQGTEAASILISAGHSIRKAVQVSLMEGCPCTERVEAVLQGVRQDLRAQMEGELGLLATRCLVPLFLLVAPALMGLVVFGLWLQWRSIS